MLRKILYHNEIFFVTTGMYFVTEVLFLHYLNKSAAIEEFNLNLQPTAGLFKQSAK